MIKLIKIIYYISFSFCFLFFSTVSAQEKIKIGLLVPMTGENKEIGESIIKAVGLAVKDIDNNLIEIFPKDTATIVAVSLGCLLYTSPSPRDS